MSIKTYFIVLAVLIVLIVGAYLIFGAKQPYPYKPSYPVPQGSIHWHPYLRIVINGQEQFIPDNIGLSSSFESPIHTHEMGSGTDEYLPDKGRKLHMENPAPASSIETLTLGYFFKAWKKNFNSMCIFDHCNGPAGNMKMSVNGKENFDYDHYFMSDGDQILITYG